MILSPGITSVIKHVFIQDSSVTTGAGKTALAYGDITAYYVRAGGVLTALTMETISTLGTWASSGNNYLGFKKLDDTNAPGIYEIHLPNNILAAGANQVTIQLRATGAAPCNIEIQLKDVSNVGAILGTALTETSGGYLAAAFKKLFDIASPVFTAASVNQTGDAYGRVGAPAGASISADVAAIKADSGAVKTQTDKLAFTVANQVDANALKIGGTTQTGRDIGASVLLSSGTGAGQLDITSGVVKANLVQILAAAITGTAAQIVSAFTKFFDKASPTGTINSLPDAVAGATGGVAIVGSAMTLTGAYDAAKTAAPESGGNVAAIKAKTDNLPSDPASNTQVNTRLATSGYSAPDNAGISAVKAKTDNLPSAPASEGNVQGHVADALAAYDPPTRAEATADKTEIAALIAKVRGALSNLLVVNPTTGAYTIYADDGVTPLLTGIISGTGRSAPTWL